MPKENKNAGLVSVHDQSKEKLLGGEDHCPLLALDPQSFSVLYYVQGGAYINYKKMLPGTSRQHLKILVLPVTDCVTLVRLLPPPIFLIYKMGAPASYNDWEDDNKYFCTFCLFILSWPFVRQSQAPSPASKPQHCMACCLRHSLICTDPKENRMRHCS